MKDSFIHQHNLAHSVIYTGLVVWIKGSDNHTGHTTEMSSLKGNRRGVEILFEERGF